MIKHSVKDRIIALLLSAVMLLPAAVFALDGPEGDVPGEVPMIEMNEADPETAGAPEDGAEANAEAEADTQNAAGDEADPAEYEEAPAEAAEPEAPAEEQAEELTETPAIEEAYLENISIEENPMGTVEIRWDAFEGAVRYEVASPKLSGGKASETDEPLYTATGLAHGSDYDFTIAAFDEGGNIIARGAISITTAAYKIKFNESSIRALSSKSVKPRKKLGINLTKLIKEPNSGYAVVQGGCTDGKYAYYLMVSSTTQKGRVLKVRIKDNKVIKRSKVLHTWHGNGMAYDSKRKKLVVIAREKRKQEITLIDAKTLRITKQRDAKYKYTIDAGSAKLSKRYKKSGLAAIAYVKKYDCYVALERVYNNLLIFDPNSFECIGLAYTNLGRTGTFQGMDADERYVYLLLSYYNEGGVMQPYNKIIALDWNSENLLPVINRCKSKDPKFVEKAWFCKNDKSGKPDATIRIRTKHEAENIYHVTKNGKEHFYLSEYYSHFVYRKVGKRRVQIYKRDNYVYDLGII